MWMCVITALFIPVYFLTHFQWVHKQTLLYQNSRCHCFFLFLYSQYKRKHSIFYFNTINVIIVQQDIHKCKCILMSHFICLQM